MADVAFSCVEVMDLDLLTQLILLFRGLHGKKQVHDPIQARGSLDLPLERMLYFEYTREGALMVKRDGAPRDGHHYTAAEAEFESTNNRRVLVPFSEAVVKGQIRSFLDPAKASSFQAAQLRDV